MKENNYNTAEICQAENSVDTENIKCSSCGSNMIFNPDKQCLVCPHCDSVISFNQNDMAQEIDLMSGLTDDNVWRKEESSVFRCINCGAKVVMQKNETALSCPFCGTAHVQKSEELAGLKPNALIPFAFGVEKALDYSKTWARKKIFAPRSFKKNLATDNIKGIYAPCFTFDSATCSTYVGRIGKTHTRTVGSGKNRRVETYVVWRNISGVFSQGYDDILITAGSKIGQDKIDKISPFGTNDGIVYEEKFLLGFMAYHYDNDLKDCWGQAKNRIDSDLRKRILAQYSYDRVAYLNVSTQHNKVTYKYVMLPVYVGAFNYKKKLFNFFVNGNTGKVAGKTPKSFWKILGTVLLGVAVVAGIATLAMIS